MTNRLQASQGRETRKTHSEWVNTQGKTEIEEVREVTESPIVSDIGSPNDSPASSQYKGESLDFGDSSVDFI